MRVSCIRMPGILVLPERIGSARRWTKGKSTSPLRDSASKARKRSLAEISLWRTASDRFLAFEAESLNVHVDFPLFQRLALPILSGKTKIPGIRIQDTRMIRLMEVLLHGGTQLQAWRTAQIHQAIL